MGLIPHLEELVDRGLVKVGLLLVAVEVLQEPIDAGHKRRPKLSEWEARETLWIFVDDELSRARAAERAEWATETAEAFLGGDQKAKLKVRKPEDAR